MADGLVEAPITAASPGDAASSPAAGEKVATASLFEIGKAFASVGLSSFGGGNASQLLLRKEVVWKQHWLTDEEYNRTWRLSRLSIGIPQVAQVVQYGQMLGGWPGVFVAMLSFLLPCAVVSLVLAAVLVALIANRYVGDALRLIVPLTGGMTMALALQMWNPSPPAKTRDW